MAEHRRAEATPFFERLCPAMTNDGTFHAHAGERFAILHDIGRDKGFKWFERC